MIAELWVENIMRKKGGGNGDSLPPQKNVIFRVTKEMKVNDTSAFNFLNV